MIEFKEFKSAPRKKKETELQRLRRENEELKRQIGFLKAYGADRNNY